MLYSYVIPSFITGIITFSWYSLYGFDFFRDGQHQDDDSPLLKASVPKTKHNIPVYMWDIYKNGIRRNGIEGADVVKGVTPKIMGPCFSSRYYPNHGAQQLEFDIPETEDGETLVQAEIRIMIKEAISPEVDWISLKVTPSVEALKKASGVSFLMLSVFRSLSKPREALKYLQPFLLLSYTSRAIAANHTEEASNFRDMKAKPRNIRRKRNLSERYEEETNRVWKGDAVANTQQRVGNICRRKPLYIEFAEIDFDTWIVAPTGYEAFQCVGKCTFPIGEHLSPTKHAIVQTLMHHVSPTKVARACCVPTRLDSISVLYIDSNGILTYRLHYHGMVVVECGCR